METTQQMEIKLTPDSSQIKSIGYSAEDKVFEIIYKNDAKYHYYDVAPELWEQAKQAESIGKFCHANIKNHQYKRIEK